MNMKRSIFSILLAIGNCLTCFANTFEWEYERKDTITGEYEKRIYKYHRRWHNLIPTHTAFQYAGSIGIVSMGLGWDYGKNGKQPSCWGICPNITQTKAKSPLH